MAAMAATPAMPTMKKGGETMKSDKAQDKAKAKKIAREKLRKAILKKFNQTKE
jgi:hypothetical protein